MKINQLKSIVKEAVRDAIQEELKDILLEAVRSPKQVVHEVAPQMQTQTSTQPIPTKTKEELRENYRNILGDTAASFNSSNISKPLQMQGSMDTASPNGKLPEGEVSMDQIMGLMKR